MSDKPLTPGDAFRLLRRKLIAEGITPQAATFEDVRYAAAAVHVDGDGPRRIGVYALSLPRTGLEWLELFDLITDPRFVEVRSHRARRRVEKAGVTLRHFYLISQVGRSGRYLLLTRPELDRVHGVLGLRLCRQQDPDAYGSCY